MAKVEGALTFSDKFNENNAKDGKSDVEECSSNNQEDTDDVFDVQKIVGMSKCDGKVLYKVRWVGYGPAHDTWEPAENLEATCLDMIEEFQKARESAKKRRAEERKRRKALVGGANDINSKDTDQPVKSDDTRTVSAEYGTLKDTFWKDLEEGRVNLFESDMYSKVKGRNSRSAKNTPDETIKNSCVESTKEIKMNKKLVERDKTLDKPKTPEDKSHKKSVEKSKSHSSHKSKHKGRSKSANSCSRDRDPDKSDKKKQNNNNNNNELECKDNYKHINGNRSLDSSALKNGGASPDSNSNSSSASSQNSFSLSALLEKYKETTARDTSDCPRVPPLKLKIPPSCKTKSHSNASCSKSSKKISKLDLTPVVEIEDHLKLKQEDSYNFKGERKSSLEILEGDIKTEKLKKDEKYFDTGQRTSLFDMFSSSNSTSPEDSQSSEEKSKTDIKQTETAEKLPNDSEPEDSKLSSEVCKTTTVSEVSCDKNSATSIDNKETVCPRFPQLPNNMPSETNRVSIKSKDSKESVGCIKNIDLFTCRTQQQQKRPSDSYQISSPKKKVLYSSDSNSEKSSPNKLGENRKRRYSRTEAYRNLKTIRKSVDPTDIYQPLVDIYDECDIQGNEANDSKDFGFDIQLDDLDWNELEQYSPEPVEISDTELSQAIHNGDYSRVRQALKCDKKYDLEQRDGAGKTLVMFAAEKGYDDIVEILVLASADINARASDGTTALMLACEQAGICTVAIMIELGANINLRHENGETALMKAVKRGHKQIVKYLLESGANFSDLTPSGYSALTYAKMLKSTDIEDIITDHISRLKADFDYQVTLTMSKTAKILNALFPVQCFPLSEGPRFKITFNHTLSKCTPGVGYLLFIAHARITSQEIKCRLYGHCATTSVTLNTCQQPSLTEDAKFVMSCSPLINGTNELVINTVHAPSSKAKLVVCAYRAELLEPT